jgi:hypothetical protein
MDPFNISLAVLSNFRCSDDNMLHLELLSFCRFSSGILDDGESAEAQQSLSYLFNTIVFEEKHSSSL